MKSACESAGPFGQHKRVRGAFGVWLLRVLPGSCPSLGARKPSLLKIEASRCWKVQASLGLRKVWLHVHVSAGHTTAHAFLWLFLRHADAAAWSLAEVFGGWVLVASDAVTPVTIL